MILSAVAIILVAIIAYFHYTQGFFSATLSAILAIISAVVALSYQEPLAALVQGKAGDQTNALALVALFAIVYTILRFAFDAAVPGNVRVPLLLDKIGAAVAGAVAGIFGVGILVIAAQMLPFGPAVAGYSRYALDAHRDIKVPSQGQSIDSSVYDEMKTDTGTFDPQYKSSLLLPVDDIVANLTSHLSDGGSLAGPVDMAQIHPAYIDELFGQRIGIQIGAKHFVANLDNQKDVSLRGLYTVDALPQAEGEITAVRKTDLTALKSDPAKIILIARIGFGRGIADDDGNIRLSTGAVRLVANQTNYTPIGTLDFTGGSPVLRVNHPDDFLILPSEGVADFVFLVPREDLGLVSGKKNETAPLQVAPDIFIDAKRAIVDLSGQTINRDAPSPGGASIKRKTNLPPAKPIAGLMAPAPLALSVPFAFDKLEVSANLFTDINVGRHDADSAIFTFSSGSVTLREKKIAKLDVNPAMTLSQIAQGDYLVHEFWTPPTARVVQAVGSPPSRSDSPWQWADNLAKFELIDTAGNSYRPHGAWAKIKLGLTDRMVGRYDADAFVTDVPRSDEGRPTDVWIAFLVPTSSTIREFRYDGQHVESLDQKV